MDRHLNRRAHSDAVTMLLNKHREQIVKEENLRRQALKLEHLPEMKK